MATWLTHLRVADLIYDKLPISDAALFFAGSVAPDVDLPPDVTHWCTGGDKTTCEADRFYQSHVASAAAVDTAFYLGYYVHLLTDIYWHQQKIEPIKKYEKAAIARIKESWKEADICFISQHKDFRPFALLRDTAKYNRQWFDYYPPNLLTHLADNIQCFINQTFEKNDNAVPAADLEIDVFVREAVVSVTKALCTRWNCSDGNERRI